MNSKPMLRWTVLCLLTLACRASAAGVSLYVSPSGNDAWSGRLANATRGDGPLASLPAALRLARDLRRQSPRQPIYIVLRGGRHVLTEPIVLTPEDSGASAESPLVLDAYREEIPVLSGGRVVHGWHRVAGGLSDLWEAQVDGLRDTNSVVRSFFVAGERRQRARTPNQGFLRIVGPSSGDTPMKLRFHGDDIKPGWAATGDVEVIALLAWSDLRMVVRSVDESSHVATLSGNPQPSNRETDARYFVENAPDGLDASGEWQFDRAHGSIRYRAFPREDPSRLETIVGGLNLLIELRGDLSTKRPVQHIWLRGLTFSHTDWTLPVNGFADTQAAVDIHGDIRAEAAVQCLVEDCHFVHLAGYGLELGRGCQNWRVARNEFVDLGAGGIRIGTPVRTEDPFLQTHSHVITDNELHDGGKVFHAGIGVLSFHSGTNRIAHNHIHHFNYTAISLGWNWGYQDTPSRKNTVEFNHLHDIGQGILSDMGAIYTLGPQPGTVIRNNLIYDVSAFTYGGWGLYPDEGSTGILWENNVVYHCKSAGFHQHYGKENIVRNNIFAFNREHQLMRTRDEDHTSFLFTNNIVYFDSGDLLGSSWKNDRFIIDRNVYFDTRAGAEAKGLRFGELTLEEWRSRGHDTNSLVVDPLFVDASHFDFRLKPESPALRMGFRPIDLGDVGVRPRPIPALKR